MPRKSSLDTQGCCIVRLRIVLTLPRRGRMRGDFPRYALLAATDGRAFHVQYRGVLWRWFVPLSQPSLRLSKGGLDPAHLISN